MAMAREAQEWTPTTEDPPPDGRAESSADNGRKGGRPKIPYADLAQEFIARKHMLEDTVILKTWRGAWYRYNGICYSEWTPGDVEAQVMAFLQTHHRENANKNTLSNIMANLRSVDLCAIPSVANAPCWLEDGFPSAYGWMAMKNALVNIDTLADQMAGIKGHSPEDIRRSTTPKLFSTFGLDYELFDGAIDTPLWEDYLVGVQPHVHDREVIQMLFGLLLVPRCYNTAFFLFGEAGTGKSVCLHVLTQLIGEGNVCCVPLAQFSDRFSTFPLTVNLANIVGDMPTESGRGDLSVLEGVFKDVCDGSNLPIERKFQDASKAPVIARCIFATNSLPHFSDRSMAIWDRLRIIGFDRRFRGTGSENRNLRYEIVDQELPGIFMWAVQGLAKLKAAHPHTFPEHTCGEREKEKLRAMCDHERTFLLENYNQSTQEGTYIEAKLVYEHYREWVNENGYRARGNANFKAAVSRVFGIEPKRQRIQGKRMTIYPTLAKDDGADLLEGQF
jgi:putative DNA primase/helicase